MSTQGPAMHFCVLGLGLAQHLGFAWLNTPLMTMSLGLFQNNFYLNHIIIVYCLSSYVYHNHFFVLISHPIPGILDHRPKTVFKNSDLDGE